MKQKTRYVKSLQGRINLSLLLVVGVAVVSFMVISINQSQTAVQDTATEYTSQLVSMVNENFDSYITNMENIARIVTENSDVQTYLFYDGPEAEKTEEYMLKVEEQFSTLKDTRDDIYNLGIISDNGRYLINNRDTVMNPYAELYDMNWFRQALEGSEVITSSHVQNIVSDEYPWVVTLSQGIANNSGSKARGVFFVDLNYSSISNLCEEINLGSRGYVFILDSEGNLVYHPRQQLIYSGLWEEEFSSLMKTEEEVVFSGNGEKLYTISKSEVTGWTVVGVTYLEEMLAGTNTARRMYYLMAIALIGVAMMLAILLTDMITMPLRKLRESMKRVENGDFDLELREPDTGDEISDLFHSFKVMVLKIRQLIEKNNEEQEEKRRSELNALQAQINPHFLYNTLDSIIWMAEGDNTRDVVLMTSSLAKLLRKSISNKNEIVTLAEEIDYTRSYLVIQKMRYKDKLEYEIEVEDAILRTEVIKLIIQPLVENAIYHGIKYKEGKGLIRIEGAYEEDNVVLRIIDNGVGMSKEQLRHVFDERKTDTRKNSVGVLNVHRRIQLYYGTEYGLSFESEENAGTTVIIRLPETYIGSREVSGHETEKHE